MSKHSPNETVYSLYIDAAERVLGVDLNDFRNSKVYHRIVDPGTGLLLAAPNTD